jgi:hypothetical protein
LRPASHGCRRVLVRATSHVRAHARARAAARDGRAPGVRGPRTVEGANAKPSACESRGDGGPRGREI